MKSSHREALAAVVLIAGALMLQTALAQAPGIPGASLPGLDGMAGPMGADHSLLVTNYEFKRFREDFTYRRGYDQYPAQVTKDEAEAYAASLGKRMGKDFMWRPLPRSEKGVIMVLMTGFVIEEEEDAPASAGPPGTVYVPEGPFAMGSDVGDADETPKHTAHTRAFWIDKYEVTNAQVREVLPDFEFKPGREDFPAVVTWEQAAAYAEKAGKRLPSEAEWEKAARGTDGRTFPWGESYDLSFTNWDENVPPGGSPARPESPYGCIDMAGGVWEWTADWYAPYPGNDMPCEAYGERYKVIRGGASFNDVAMMRTTHRYYLPPDTTGHLHVGFRCVKDAK